MQKLSAVSDRHVHRFIIALVALAVGFNLWTLTRAWNENFRDAFESRQYQTALTAYHFQKDGIRLAYETPVLGPPWSIPMEFPLYQAIVVKLSSLSGLPLEQAGRLTSILAFYLSLPAGWLLLRKRLPNPHDFSLVLIATLLSPLFLFYSRTFMIESTALCASLWFLAAFDAALSRPASWLVPAAWLLGAIAAVTKITTFAVVCPPAIVIVAGEAYRRRRTGLTWFTSIQTPLLVAVLLAIVPLAAGFGWVVYSDNLKELNPYGRILTSTSLREFNFGTLALRTSGAYWKGIVYHTSQHVVSIPCVIVLLAGLFFIAPPYRRLAGWCAAWFCGGFLLFANLYHVHDYYYYASAIFLTTAVGAAAAGLIRSPRVPRVLGLIVAAAMFGSEAWAFHTSYGGFYRRPNLPAPPMAKVIKEATRPEHVFAAMNYDWNPMIPYLAQRRAIMIFQSHTEDIERLKIAVENLRPDHLAAVLIGEPHRKHATFLFQVLGELEMEREPIASSVEGDLYVRRDLLRAVIKQLHGKIFPEITLRLPQPLQGEFDLTRDDWPSRLTLATPAPFGSRGEFAIGIVDVGNNKAISTQAPTEILFKPPAGATRVKVQLGMLPGAYLNGNTTDGVLIEIQEERPDGTVRTLFRRALQPLNIAEDRQEVVVDYAQDTPLLGTLVFGAYPGPAGSAAFDWVYWRNIEVR